MPISSIQTNVADVRRELLQLTPKLRVRAIRNALANAARIVRDEARRRAPVLKLSTFSGQSAYRRGLRKPGTVRKAIVVRTSKAARRRGDVGVFVNVKPAPRGQRGARSANDPFYWRWLNWGWTPASGPRRDAAAARRQRRAAVGVAKAKPGQRFLEAGAGRLQEALQRFNTAMAAAIAKLNNPKAPPP